jgi:hypothetical protein
MDPARRQRRYEQVLPVSCIPSANIHAASTDLKNPLASKNGGPPAGGFIYFSAERAAGISPLQIMLIYVWNKFLFGTGAEATTDELAPPVRLS